MIVQFILVPVRAFMFRLAQAAVATFLVLKRRLVSDLVRDIRIFSILFVALLCMTGVNAAPQIESPGFYISTLGVTADQKLDSYYTRDGYFIPLQNAAALSFAPGADIAFVVEKAGNVRVIVDGTLQPRPVVDMRDQVSDWVDSGLIGVGVHPDFPEVKEILLSYTHHNGVTPIEDGSKYAKVARLGVREEINNDGVVEYYADPPAEEDVIVGKLSATTDFPSCNDRPIGADCGAVDHSAHPFTFVTYGPDGKIYIGTGDGAGYFSPDPEAFYAQIDDHLSGKILRVNPDGSGPDDNPFFTGNKWDNRSKVFAKGLRNPKSGSFDPETGKLCVGNVGWFLNEGIYCLSPGDNVGWPCEENGPAQNGYQVLSLTRDDERLASCPLEPGTYIAPDYSYAHQKREIDGKIVPVGAVIGCARPTAAEYPENFKGSCVFGDYVFDTLESVRFGDGNGNPSSTLVLSGAGLPADIATDYKGRVCYVAYQVATIDGLPVSEVRCVRYDATGTVEQYPVPSFISFPDPANLDVIKFDATDSYHTAGLALEYDWDFGDGKSGKGAITEHKYESFGDFRVTLTVSTKGENVERTTFQVVRVQNPDFITPIIPSVVNVKFTADVHTFSAPVEFDVRVRNDKGSDAFRILANIYDDTGREVAHLVEESLQQLDAGEITTVSFRWPTATELGTHTIGIEFYAADWESWTLKYPDVANFFVRNRASGTVTTATNEPASDDDASPDDDVSSDPDDDVSPDSNDDSSQDDSSQDDDVIAPDGSVEDDPATDGASDNELKPIKSSSGGCTVGSESDITLLLLMAIALLVLSRRQWIV